MTNADAQSKPKLQKAFHNLTHSNQVHSWTTPTAQMLKCSTAPLHKCSNAQMLNAKRSNTHLRYSGLSKLRQSSSNNTEATEAIQAIGGVAANAFPNSNSCLDNDALYAGPSLPVLPPLNMSAPNADEVQQQRRDIARGTDGSFVLFCFFCFAFFFLFFFFVLRLGCG